MQPLPHGCEIPPRSTAEIHAPFFGFLYLKSVNKDGKSFCGNFLCVCYSHNTCNRYVNKYSYTFYYNHLIGSYSYIKQPSYFLAAVRSTGLSEISECICEGYSAVYECTVEGPGSTVWKGGSFRDCPNNRITLFHSQFRSGTNGTCNAGSVVGRSVRVEGSCYTSQLNIITSPDVVGTTIFCAYDDGLNEMDIGNSTVTLTTGTIL